MKNYSEHGREFIFSEIGAGQIFGEFSAIDGLPRSASVVAMEDSVVARMKAVDFVALLRADFDLTLRLLRILTGKARGLSDRIFELIALNARDRICYELARLAVTGVRDGPRVLDPPGAHPLRARGADRLPPRGGDAGTEPSRLAGLCRARASARRDRRPRPFHPRSPAGPAGIKGRPAGARRPSSTGQGASIATWADRSGGRWRGSSSVGSVAQIGLILTP